MKLVKKLYNGDWLDWIIRKVNTFLVKNGKFPYKPFLNDEFRDHEGIAELKECFDVIQEELLEASKVMIQQRQDQVNFLAAKANPPEKIGFRY